jgi:hypothetical protein
LFSEVLVSYLGPETSCPEALEENAVIVPQIRPQLLPSTSFPIQYSQMIIKLNATWSELVVASLDIQIHLTPVNMPKSTFAEYQYYSK